MQTFKPFLGNRAALRCLHALFFSVTLISVCVCVHSYREKKDYSEGMTHLHSSTLMGSITYLE